MGVPRALTMILLAASMIAAARRLADWLWPQRTETILVQLDALMTPASDKDPD